MEKEVCRLRCKGKEDERRNKDGIRIDLRGDIVINGVEGVEEGVAPIDLYLNSILEEGGVSGYDVEGITTRPTISHVTPASSCPCT